MCSTRARSRSGRLPRYGSDTCWTRRPVRAAGRLRLALFRGVADRFELEAVGVEPVGREAVLPVLGELRRLVEDCVPSLARPAVRVPDDGSALDEEREVVEAGSAA